MISDTYALVSMISQLYGEQAHHLLLIYIVLTGLGEGRTQEMILEGLMIEDSRRSCEARRLYE